MSDRLVALVQSSTARIAAPSTVGQPGSRWRPDVAEKAVRVGPALGDQVLVPAQQRCRLDEEAPETVTGEQSCQAGHYCPVGSLKHRTVNLAAKDRDLVAQASRLRSRGLCH